MTLGIFRSETTLTINFVARGYIVNLFLIHDKFKKTHKHVSGKFVKIWIVLVFTVVSVLTIMLESNFALCKKLCRTTSCLVHST